MVTIMLLNGKKMEFDNLKAMLENADFFVAVLDPIAIMGTERANEITQITVNREPLGDDFAGVITSCPKLQVLNLCWCNIDSNVIGCVISAIEKSSTLREVDLKGNPIGSKGALTFVPLISRGQLASLNLQFCGIGEAGAAALREAATLSSSSINLVLAGDARHTDILPSYLPKFFVVQKAVSSCQARLDPDNLFREGAFSKSF